MLICTHYTGHAKNAPNYVQTCHLRKENMTAKQVLAFVASTCHTPFLCHANDGGSYQCHASPLMGHPGGEWRKTFLSRVFIKETQRI